MIRTIAQPKCPVCNTAGVYLYGKLTDELFQSEGTWSMKRCNALDCGTLWLDPTPLPDDLKILYNTYSTHVRPPQEKSVSKKPSWIVYEKQYGIVLLPILPKTHP